MLNLTHLETYVWVIRLRGFRNAARRLNTTQSAVSQRIASLETALGITLVDRQTRHVTPTPAGAQLIPHIEQMLRLHSTIRRLTSTPASRTHHIRIGVAETIAQTCLVELLQTVQRTHPRLTVDIEVNVSTKLRDTLLQGELDIIIPAGRILEANVRNVALINYELAWIASPTLPIADNPTLQDISRYPVLTYEKNTQPYQELQDLLLQAGITDFKLYGSSSLSAIVRLCEGGIGVAAIPRESVMEELQAGQLRALNVHDGALPPLQFSVCYVPTADTWLLDSIVNCALATIRKSQLTPSAILAAQAVAQAQAEQNRDTPASSS